MRVCSQGLGLRSCCACPEASGTYPLRRGWEGAYHGHGPRRLRRPRELMPQDPPPPPGDHLMALQQETKAMSHESF